jgi:hypothetical protein
MAVFRHRDAIVGIAANGKVTTGCPVVWVFYKKSTQRYDSRNVDSIREKLTKKRDVHIWRRNYRKTWLIPMHKYRSLNNRIKAGKRVKIVVDDFCSQFKNGYDKKQNKYNTHVYVLCGLYQQVTITFSCVESPHRNDREKFRHSKRIKHSFIVFSFLVGNK